MSQVRDLFDEWARAGRAADMERGHAPAARQAFDRLRLRHDAHYLDIGCGNGYTVRWAAAAAPRGTAVGVDASTEMIGLARKMSVGLSNVELVAGEFPAVELPGGPYDTILSMEVFYYLPDLDDSLRAVHGLLRPGGLFACVVDYYGENEASHSWPSEMGVPMTLLDSAGWADALRRAGLAVVAQRRLRVPRDQATSTWKTTQGSLMTLGRR